MTTPWFESVEAVQRFAATSYGAEIVLSKAQRLREHFDRQSTRCTVSNAGRSVEQCD